jgi:3-oxoacyl-[acyl-carrier protein] reductase
VTSTRGPVAAKASTAVVTAAAGAMGSAIVLELIGRGLRVVATDISGRRLEGLQSVAEERGLADGLAGWVKADATRRESVEEITEYAMDLLGHVDVLVNVVGGYRGDLYTGGARHR